MTWGNPQTFTDKLQKGILNPLTFFYGVGQSLHKGAFDKGLLQQYKAPVPVISIGNITCGGTGKTPVVIDLANRFVNTGHKIAILSRGYKRKGDSAPTVVSDGQGNFSSCLAAGDEPFLIAQSIPKAVVISSTDRVSAAQQAVDNYRCDLLLLDDGFQHYRLKRDLDVVLIEYGEDLLNDSLLPGGRLREPITNLKRASNIIITKVPKRFDRARMKQLEKLMLSLSPQATINSCRFNPKTICRQEDNEIVHSSTKSLAGVNVFAFCGLARPEAFISSLQELGANIVGQKFFPDHHWYTERDINFLESKLRNEQTGYLVTTQKDFVKLSSGRLQAKLAYIELETEWLNNFPKAIQTFVDFGHQRRYRSSYPYQSSEKQFLKR